MAILPQLAFDFEGQSPKLCDCGCGLPAPIATKTVKRMGWVKGQPKRFRHGHYAKAIYAFVAVRTEKPCPKCETVKPLDDFGRNKWSADGRTWLCKICRAKDKRMLLRRWQDEEHRTATGLKRCSQCQEWKSPAEFGPCPEASDGLQYACVPCMRRYWLDWYRSHHDAAKRSAAASRERRRDTLRAKARKREAEQIARQCPLRRARKLRWSQSAKGRTYNREWQQQNPENVRSHAANRRARIKNAPRRETIDTAVIIARDRSTCYLCGGVFRRDQIEIDHVVPLARGGPHTYDNMRVACGPCNARKHTKLLSECAWAISTG